MKQIRISNHALGRMQLRGATDEEVSLSINIAPWENAKGNKKKVKHTLDCAQESPVNGKFYKFKTIEAIFVDEPDEVVIVTVKVYYSNEEA